MAAPIKATMPPGLDLGDSYTILIRAIDPTTGADVAGVVISDVSIMVDQLAGPSIKESDVEPPLLAHEPGGNVPQPQGPGTNP